jgi:hypothetical protein
MEENIKLEDENKKLSILNKKNEEENLKFKN